MSKKEQLQEVVKDIFTLTSPKINDSRMEQVSEFITSTVNGDNFITYLAINVGLGKEKKEGVVCYILTNKRLIKIDIDEVNIESKNFWLNTIVNSERKLIDGNREQFDIIFQNGAFGLKYPAENKKITAFFQAI